MTRAVESDHYQLYLGFNMAGGSEKLKPTNKQPMISRFFAQTPTKSVSASKRKPVPKRKAATSTSIPTGERDSSPVDLTHDSDDDIEILSPPAKKQKTAHVNKHLFLPGGTPTPEPEPKGGPSSPSPTRNRTAPNSPVHDRLKYDPSQLSPTRTASELLEKQQKRARLAKALIADNSSFHRARDAASSDKEREKSAHEQEEESGDDDKFKELKAAFSLKPAKTPARGKGKEKEKKAAAGKKGKDKEIGPSGQTYTPLELQVREGTLCS